MAPRGEESKTLSRVSEAHEKRKAQIEANRALQSNLVLEYILGGQAVSRLTDAERIIKRFRINE